MSLPSSNSDLGGGPSPSIDLRTDIPRGTAAISISVAAGPEEPAAPDLAADILRGADKIAEFLLGDAKQRRKVYHLAEQSRLPTFKLGATLCARKSVILTWIRSQEVKATPDGRL